MDGNRIPVLSRSGWEERRPDRELGEGTLNTSPAGPAAPLRGLSEGGSHAMPLYYAHRRNEHESQNHIQAPKGATLKEHSIGVQYGNYPRFRELVYRSVPYSGISESQFAIHGRFSPYVRGQRIRERMPAVIRPARISRSRASPTPSPDGVCRMALSLSFRLRYHY